MGHKSLIRTKKEPGLWRILAVSGKDSRRTALESRVQRGLNSADGLRQLFYEAAQAGLW